MCTDIFGPKFDIALLEKGVAETNTHYGGLDIQVVLYQTFEISGIEREVFV